MSRERKGESLSLGQKALQLWSRFKGAGLVLGPVLFAIDLVLNALEIWNLDVKTWIFGAVGALTFVGSGYAVLHERQAKIDALEKERDALKAKAPAISVDVINDRQGPRIMMCLETTNNGEKGDFTGQIEVLDGHLFMHGLVRPPRPYYPGYWQQVAGPITSLSQGGRDRLMIGYHQLDDNFGATFKMAFWDTTS
jgi:hypothetical protein